MKKRLGRFLASLVLATVSLVTLATPVLAIAPPDSEPSIDKVSVYRSCIETNDQLYVFEYSIDYASPPTEDIDQAFIFRLMNGATELKSTTAYAYNTQGYGTGSESPSIDGIAAIYFTAQDITDKSMTWQGSYTAVVAGNPTLSWSGGGCPYQSTSTFESWDDPMGDNLRQDVLALAESLTSSWGLTGANRLYIEEGGTQVLSSNGEDYFSTTIPNLMTMEPDLFSASMQAVLFPERDNPLTEATALSYTYWASSPFDLSRATSALNISDTFIYGLMWAVITFGLFLLLAKDRVLNLEFFLLIGGIMTTYGALLRFVPMLVPIMIGVVLVLIFVYKFFLSPSGA